MTGQPKQIAHLLVGASGANVSPPICITKQARAHIPSSYIQCCERGSHALPERVVFHRLACCGSDEKVTSPVAERCTCLPIPSHDIESEGIQGHSSSDARPPFLDENIRSNAVDVNILRSKVTTLGRSDPRTQENADDRDAAKLLEGCVRKYHASRL